MHRQYPNPEIQTYAYGETADLGSYEITFDNWEEGNLNLVQERAPDFQIYTGEADSRAEEVRAGFIHFTIDKTGDGKDVFDISNVSFSSGAWGNQFDMDLFYQLNPDMRDMIVNLAPGEQQKITLPFILQKSHFTQAQWAEIDNRTIYIDLQYYPEHIRFVCPALLSAKS